MKYKQILVLMLIFTHLLFIFYRNISALGTFNDKRIQLNHRSKIVVSVAQKIELVFPDFYKNFLDNYAKYTGITGYVFFSPNPPDSYLIYFTYQQNNKEIIEELPMKTFEGKLRSSCSYDFMKEIEDKQIKDLMARSIAARFFELHPFVKEMTMKSAYYGLPSTEEYAKGEKPNFVQHLSYTFRYN